MATITVTSTADSGSGSLRQAIADAQSGDTIVFDDELEDANGVITIALSSVISISAKELTINGGSHTGSGATLATRVILDAQSASRVFSIALGADVTIINLNLSNASTEGGGVGGRGGCINMPPAAAILTAEYCVFYNTKTSNNGGVLFIAVSGHVVTIKDCLFDTCSCSNTFYGGAICINKGTLTINNSYFKKCTTGAESGNGGGIGALTDGTTTLNNCVFDACEAKTHGQAVSVINAAACYFNGVTTINSVGSIETIYANSTALNAFAGVNIIQKITITNIATINGTLTADVLTISNGATVTFDGVDSILAATTTATIGAATFTAAEGSTGYIALPAGTATPTVGENVIVGEYGANVTSVAASIDQDVATIDVSAGDPSKTYIVEASSDGGETWTQIALVDKKTTLASARAYKFRTFDGHFVTSITIPRVYYYNGSPTAGSFATAADWALDESRTIVCPDSPTIAGGVFYCV